MREIRTYGSERAKAEWLRYSTIFLNVAEPSDIEVVPVQLAVVEGTAPWLNGLTPNAVTSPHENDPFKPRIFAQLIFNPVAGPTTLQVLVEAHKYKVPETTIISATRIAAPALHVAGSSLAECTGVVWFPSCAFTEVMTQNDVMKKKGMSIFLAQNFICAFLHLLTYSIIQFEVMQSFSLLSH